MKWMNLLVLASYFSSALSEIGDSDTQTCDSSGVCISKAGAKLPKHANAEGKPPDIKLGECNDRNENCAIFVAQGECTKNPGWMIVNCPKSCDSCHLLDRKIRCQRSFLNISTDPAYHPGDLQAMFERITTKFSKYEPTVLSTSPWIVTFDNFLSDAEITALLTTATDNGKNWERSTDTGSVNEYGETGRVLSMGRTSSNAWCRKNCENHPAVKRITSRIEHVTGVSFMNSESFQVNEVFISLFSLPKLRLAMIY
jgi:hypothetical protein